MLNVICLKHGIKYSSDYVNKLYNMMERHLTIPYRFVCFTDDHVGIDPRVEIRLLPDARFQGWWWKPYVFKDDHFMRGDTNFFMDLDMVIVKNINHLITYRPGEFLGLRDPGRVFRQDYQKLGSAVMRWPAGEFGNIWSDFDRDPAAVGRLHGDQDWIWQLHQNSIKFYPDEWIRSYKWEIRNRSELAGYGRNSYFLEVRNPEIPHDTAVLAFHGNPPVHDVQDPVILENWR
jgi:hypothetical protein